ncbi:MAG: ABC transporter permease [Actinomycetota bacterium]|nr:ABC transporter permease [Actinomycetota bacterium]
MRDLRILAFQTRFALLAARRNPSVLVFNIALPIFLLVLFEAVFTRGGNRTTHVAGELISTKAYYVAGLAAYAVMLQTFTTLAINVTTQRETGQLKRLRGTPMPAWSFIGANVLRSVALVVTMVLVVFLIGTLAFGVHLHGAGVLGLVLYVALATIAFSALGLAVTVVCRTTESAGVVGPFAAIILSFLSGAFIPIAVLPSWLATVGKVFPLYHLAAGMQRGLAENAAGTGLTAVDLGILAIWALAGLLLAVRFFRWEPQASRG